MALLHEVEAETLQITRFRKVGCRKSYAFAGLRTAPATHRARNTANTTFSCRMLQNTGFGTITWGGEGGGGSEPRTGIIYTRNTTHSYSLHTYIHREGEGEGCQEAGSTFCDYSKSWSWVTVHVRAIKAPWDVPYRYTNLVEYMDMPPTWPSLFFVVSSGSHAHEHRSPISVLQNLKHDNILTWDRMRIITTSMKTCGWTQLT